MSEQIKILSHEEMLDFMHENENIFKTVSMYCKNHVCRRCIFFDEDGEYCKFDNYSIPLDWDFSKISIKED